LIVVHEPNNSQGMSKSEQHKWTFALRNDKLWLVLHT